MVVEDEEHVLMKCEAYGDLRSDLFKLLDPPTETISTNFVDIMGSKDPNTIFYTSKFLEKAFKKRHKILNHCKIALNVS